ncbi:protein kinase superfamily protein [Anaeramoeba flamelloides]|uniref:non-specific serine/threonine protein kinase n=1 Tax=Anaeramoeba flamelloides TaxID=1746091 RepID=A0ABQ8XRH5_9EUKA|nr:protein kinase superfamily protein [Anaeramoeba flamelloides]
MTTKPKPKPKPNQKQQQVESSSSEEEDASEYTKGGYHPVKTGEIFNRRFKAICKIGWGYFSTVWLAKDLRNGDFIALKVIKSEKTFAEAAEDEIELLKSVSKNDPYGKFKVVRLLDHFVHKGPNGNHICMVFELLDGTTLLSLLKKYKYKGIPIKSIKDIIKQVLIALNFLHQKCKIIHTDLKPENIMIFKQVGSISEKLKEKIQKSGLKLEDILKNKPKIKSNRKTKNSLKPKNHLKKRKKIIQKNNNRKIKKIIKTKNLKTPQPKKNQKNNLMKKRFLSQRKPQQLKKKKKIKQMNSKKITKINSKKVTKSNPKKVNNTQKIRMTFKEKLGSLNKTILQLESELEKETAEEFVELNDLPFFENPFEITIVTASNNNANSETVNQNKGTDQSLDNNEKGEDNEKDNDHENAKDNHTDNEKEKEQNKDQNNETENANGNNSEEEKDNVNTNEGNVKEKEIAKENEKNNNNEEDKDQMNAKGNEKGGNNEKDNDQENAKDNHTDNEKEKEQNKEQNNQKENGNGNNSEEEKKNVNNTEDNVKEKEIVNKNEKNNNNEEDKDQKNAKGNERGENVENEKNTDQEKGNDKEKEKEKGNGNEKKNENDKKNENEKNNQNHINSKNPRPKKTQTSLNCKIIDLGNACWVDKHFTEEIQTREYRSPEVILGHGYDKSADIWSLGCMFFELLTGDVLFQPTEGTDYSDDEDHLALIMELLGKIPKKMLTTGSKSRLLADRHGNLKHIKNLEFWGLENVLFEKYKFSKKDTKEICDFLLPMFDYDMKKRITAKRLLNHSWLKVNNSKRRINNRKKKN